MTLALLRPSPGNITESFGPRPKPTPTSPAIHYGIDFGWGNGDVVTAARGGVVTSAASAGAYGNRVVIEHEPGIETWYCHLSSFSVGVGARVNAGQPVGVQGTTGNVTAKHLHFELRINGTAVDPLGYFTTLTEMKGITVPKIISVPEGTIAIVTETFGNKYTTMEGGQGYSIAVNRKVYGEHSGLTEDEVTTLVAEANQRGAILADAVAARVKG
ncbi:M23 family metallopeptidase [Plantibacter sp. YIM 135347]|uniref:M23 family metallopeptidase n=1 Tax=Plantibacter sp. YIM 135347 TaxID=3423919 RepID=UPI003D34DBAF